MPAKGKARTQRATRSGRRKPDVSKKSLRSPSGERPLTPGWTAANADMFKLPKSPSTTKTERVTRRSSVFQKVTTGGKVIGTVLASESSEAFFSDFKMQADIKRKSVYQRTQVVSSSLSPALTRSRRASFMQRSTVARPAKRAIKPATPSPPKKVAIKPATPSPPKKVVVRKVVTKSPTIQVKDESDDDYGGDDDDVEVTFNYKGQSKTSKIPKPASGKQPEKKKVSPAKQRKALPSHKKSLKRRSQDSPQKEASPAKKPRTPSPTQRKTRKVSPRKSPKPKSLKQVSPSKKVSPQKKTSPSKQVTSKRKITKETIQKTSSAKRARSASASPRRSRSPRKSKKSPRLSIVPTPVKVGEKVNVATPKLSPKTVSPQKVTKMTELKTPEQKKSKSPARLSRSAKKVIIKSPTSKSKTPEQKKSKSPARLSRSSKKVVTKSPTPKSKTPEQKKSKSPARLSRSSKKVITKSPTPKILMKSITKSPKSTPRARPHTPGRLRTPSRTKTPVRGRSPKKIASVSKKITKVTTFITPSPDASSPGPKKLPRKLTPGRTSTRTPVRTSSTPPKAARLLGKTPGGTPIKAARILGKTPGGTPVKAARILGKTPMQTPMTIMTRSRTPPRMATPMSESRFRTASKSSVVVRKRITNTSNNANTMAYEESMADAYDDDDDDDVGEGYNSETETSGMEIAEKKPDRWSWWSWCTIL